MPTTSHVEKHFTTVAAVRDVVIGMSDGLTVPFALAAGLTGAVAAAATGIIVTAGLAEIAAGSIAMGLGGYLAAKTDSEHYESEKLREYREIEEIPDQEELEIVKVFRDYGLTRRAAQAGREGDSFEQRSLGGFYDALRTWIGKARSGAGGKERGDDCGVLYRGRIDSV